MNVIEKLILHKCQDYDFNRYRFKSGDIVTTLDGAKIFVMESALEYVDAYVLKSSFTMRRGTRVHVDYKNLPYIGKGEFTSERYVIRPNLNWQVCTFVKDPTTEMVLLLTEETDKGFYGYVVDDAGNSYYSKTSVFVMNPYRDYLVGGL